MEILQRTFISNDWITLIFVVAFVLVALMKLYKPKLLLGYSLAFFSQGFIEKRVDKNPSVFTAFNILLFSFSVITYSLAFTFIYAKTNEFNISLFLIILGVLLSVVILKYLLSITIAAILSIDEEIKYFLFSKTGYLYNMGLWLFPVLIFSQYCYYNFNILFIFSILLLSFRAILIIKNNKKLIFNNFFYFILYFCTLELAPLLIIYKTTTT
ncbi:DUF4271 domain-containing protein [Tenacibaculum sp. M341]|uniref:DUF4271 domain-containing protein n=1 Tax=Tenacibaculum sp. M341 TaxID=2530339 RepID=UPI0010489B06|nr:DUF4271 domain-containing protein [Tenacibaculum sp. M341]TCI92305.1 DUF4271 domain-containing protein [Tenacibaculum sp. M341]